MQSLIIVYLMRSGSPHYGHTAWAWGGSNPNRLFLTQLKCSTRAQGQGWSAPAKDT